MIVTVTPNPALDKTAELDTLLPGGLNRLQNITVDAGGKGINVSKIIAALGGQSLATGFTGGAAGQQLLGQLTQMGLQHDFVQAEGSVRTNLKLLEASGAVTELNEPGLAADAPLLDALLQKLLGLAAPDTLFVLSGSLPQKAGTDTYCNFTKQLRAAGAKVFVDADGESFRQALLAPPNYIKPNREELLAHFNVQGKADIALLRSLCQKLLDTGVELVALSMGADGALFVTQQMAVRAQGLKVQAHSTVGAGDSMVGALALALQQKMPLEEAFSLAVAASAGAVTTIGTNPPTLALVQQLQQQVVLEHL